MHLWLSLGQVLYSDKYKYKYKCHNDPILASLAFIGADSRTLCTNIVLILDVAASASPQRIGGFQSGLSFYGWFSLHFITFEYLGVFRTPQKLKGLKIDLKEIQNSELPFMKT